MGENAIHKSELAVEVASLWRSKYDVRTRLPPPLPHVSFGHILRYPLPPVGANVICACVLTIFPPPHDVPAAAAATATTWYRCAGEQ